MASVVLGVGGSIAAYKACDIASKLVQQGHRVDVVMTRAATGFVRPLSFSALTHRPVFTDREWGRGSMPHDHLKLTEGADVLVVAPCTANLLAKFALGLADDILSATWLATPCPRIVAPAMNHRMWANPRVQANAAALRQDGVVLVGPEEGYLAEGETGRGRMSEPATILDAISDTLTSAG